MDTATLKDFILQFELALATNPDEVQISVSMSRDPLVADIISLTGGSGSKVGRFLGKPIRVKPDVVAIQWANKGV